MTKILIITVINLRYRKDKTPTCQLILILVVGYLIWETLRREPMLDKRAAAKSSENLSRYSYEKGIYMKVNYFNADHTHALIDLPTNLSIEQVVQLLKGGSSHGINHNRLVKGRFAWGRGYGAFS